MKIQKKRSGGEGTRGRLLNVATTLFSEKGYAAVSTRDIARAAETTLPSIPHHFGSKEGLYAAVLNTISEEIAAKIEPASQHASGVLGRKGATRRDRVDALELLIGTHARTMLEGQQEWAKLIVIEQLQPTGALTPINTVWAERLVDPAVRLLTSLSPISITDAKLKTLILLGRVIIFRAGRSSMLNVMGWDDLTPVRINKILEILQAELRMSIGA